MTVLEAKQLHKVYQLGEQIVVALDRVNFIVEKGEFVAIMGPSGSGKSTLLHLLGGLDKPSDGSILLGGVEFSTLDDQKATLARRKAVGFVFQFFNLLPTLSAEENVTLPLIIDGKNIGDYKDKIDTLLGLVGLDQRRDHKPDQLSGGEQQRVSIARALITEPAIILADEPTGNLDSSNSKAIMELLRRTCEQLGQTTIIVTHDPRSAAYANRIIFLKDGNIISTIFFKDGQSLADRVKVIVKQFESLEL